MITIIGDVIVDEDYYLKNKSISKEQCAPVYEIEQKYSTYGGAYNVYNTINKLRGPCHIIHGKMYDEQCIKRRYYTKNTLFARIDLDCIDPIDVDRAIAILMQIPEQTRYILVADYGKGVITPYAWQLLLETRCKIIVDPARDKPLDFYRGAYGIVPNRIEADVASVYQAQKKVEELLKIFPYVCIKLDVNGMVFSTKDHFYHIPSACKYALDTIGAGDVVLGAIGYSLQQNENWIQSCMYANGVVGEFCSKTRREKHEQRRRTDSGAGNTEETNNSSSEEVTTYKS